MGELSKYNKQTSDEVQVCWKSREEFIVENVYLFCPTGTVLTACGGMGTLCTLKIQSMAGDVKDCLV